eukprot:Hpha_TRINITY_DN16512_c3_g3::TRINITY_DN16512_c3_g3_i1::g.134788::m.134788
MPGVSLQCASIALSVALVSIAGGIIGALSISLGNKAHERTKTTWREGLDDMIGVSVEGFADFESACDNSISESLDLGTDTAENLTRRLMLSTLSVSVNEIRHWAGAPMLSVATIWDYFHSYPSPALWPDFSRWDTALGMMKPLFHNGYKEARGVTGIRVKTGRRQGVDGVQILQGVDWRKLPGFRDPVIVVPVNFECYASYSQSECLANSCTWCVSPTGGVCSNPMRKNPADVNFVGPPEVCPPGYSLPAGYEMNVYQTSLIRWALGIANKDGTPYWGSCGLDGECGCSAVNDYNAKHGDHMNIEVNGSFKSTLKNGKYPPMGQSPVTEPGMCKIPDGFSGLYRTLALQSGRYKRTPEIQWSTAGYEMVTSQIELGCFITEEVCLPGDPNCVYLTVEAAVDIAEVSKFLKAAAREQAAGTRLYAVQHDSYLAADPCEDDFYGLLESATMNCAIVISLWDLSCDFQLAKHPILSLIVQRNIYLRDLCPAFCGVCINGSFPVHLFEGILVASSHGDAHENLPLNESGCCLNKPGRENSVLDVPDAIPMHATQSSDPVIAGHAKSVMTHQGGKFSTLPEAGTWEEGDAESSSTWWVMVKHTHGPPSGASRVTELVMTVVMLVDRSEAIQSVVSKMETTRDQVQRKQQDSVANFNEARQSTLQDIYSNDEDTEKEKKESIIILYSTAGLSAVFLVVLSVVLVRLVIAPLLQLQEDMAAVAFMRLEGVDREGTLSRLSEVKSMQKSFRKMVANLIEFRSYMPQSVLVLDDTSEGADESTLNRHASWNSKQSTGSAADADEGSQSTNVSQQEVKRIKAVLKKARVTLVSSNVVGYLSHHNDFAGHSHTDWMAADVAQWVQCVGDVKGLVDTVSGDRRSASFNARQSCASHAPKAISVAFSRSTPGMRVSSGVATGQAVCGDFGSASLIRFMILGTLPSVVLLLERVARQWNCSVLVTQEAYGDSEFEWDGLLKGCVIYSKRSKTSSRLFSIIGHKEVGVQDNDEWMYQMASLPANKHAGENESAEAAIKAELNSADDTERSPPNAWCWVMEDVGLYPLSKTTQVSSIETPSCALAPL